MSALHATRAPSPSGGERGGQRKCRGRRMREQTARTWSTRTAYCQVFLSILSVAICLATVISHAYSDNPIADSDGLAPRMDQLHCSDDNPACLKQLLLDEEVSHASHASHTSLKWPWDELLTTSLSLWCGGGAAYMLARPWHVHMKTTRDMLLVRSLFLGSAVCLLAFHSKHSKLNGHLLVQAVLLQVQVILCVVLMFILRELVRPDEALEGASVLKFTSWFPKGSPLPSLTVTLTKAFDSCYSDSTPSSIMSRSSSTSCLKDPLSSRHDERSHSSDEKPSMRKDLGENTGNNITLPRSFKVREHRPSIFDVNYTCSSHATQANGSDLVVPKPRLHADLSTCLEEDASNFTPLNSPSEGSVNDSQDLQV